MTKRQVQKKPLRPRSRNARSSAKAAHGVVKDNPEQGIDASAAALYDSLASIARQVRAADLPDGLSIERLRLLGTIRQCGPIRLTDLAARESLSLAATSRSVATFDESGLVRKKRGADDARSVRLTITKKGERTFIRGIRKFFLSWVNAVEQLEPGQFNSLIALMGKARSPGAENWDSAPRK